LVDVGEEGVEGGEGRRPGDSDERWMVGSLEGSPEAATLERGLRGEGLGMMGVGVSLVVGILGQVWVGGLVENFAVSFSRPCPPSCILDKSLLPSLGRAQSHLAWITPRFLKFSETRVGTVVGGDLQGSLGFFKFWSLALASPLHDHEDGSDRAGVVYGVG
jgi:hypothetical protein